MRCGSSRAARWVECAAVKSSPIADEIIGEAMRAAVYYGPRDLRLESVPDPQAGPGDVKLRVLYNGICGSDLHEYYDGPVTIRVASRNFVTRCLN
jgi:Alcohol dehydrogenase GroES-associated